MSVHVYVYSQTVSTDCRHTALLSSSSLSKFKTTFQWNVTPHTQLFLVQLERSLNVAKIVKRVSQTRECQNESHQFEIVGLLRRILLQNSKPIFHLSLIYP